MSCACTAVMRTRFSVSAKCAFNCASCACRCAYCRFLFDDIDVFEAKAEEGAREVWLLLLFIEDIIVADRAVAAAGETNGQPM
jgi:hypothetical protein